MTTTPPKHASGAFRLALALLKSPGRGAEACRAPDALAPAAKIFGTFLALSVLFYWWKPADFPERLLDMPGETLTLFFWLKATLVQLPFEAATIAFTIAFLTWMRDGSFPFKMITGAAWVAFALVINVVAYAQHASAVSKPLFAAGALAAFLPFIPLLRRAPREELRPVAAFLLALNAIGVALYAPMALTVVAEWTAGFKALQIAGALWLIGASTLGLRALTGVRLRSTFMAFLLATCFQIAAAFTLHLLGVPGNWLKAAMLYG